MAERKPQVGDWADHKYRELDPREVVKVSEDGTLIWIKILTDAPVGPLPAENYDYLPPLKEG